ncbi:hypothetical protein C2E20_8345 [Micractinium conductrix]|uniref:Uncharacterized protein n=1 Tax=Micractinium conductrix TaxID=554055 RepID=A0A2P6V1T4_9CHLO|nr:hypothetical protein C2E20_8345 [Micractinium conductrix]|eukprot:PSC68056.1 hypothetical protein C2E20_8345 [Micractinium conductrix]
MQAVATVAPLAAAPAAVRGTRHAPAVRGLPTLRFSHQQQQRAVATRALGDSSTDKKGIRREDEPEEYWTSEAERAGKSPFQDPLAQIGILAILFPFIFLALAIAFGWVDLNAGR